MKVWVVMVNDFPEEVCDTYERARKRQKALDQLYNGKCKWYQRKRIVHIHECLCKGPTL